MDINNGLQSNTVRVIKEDNQHRTWLGTDQGLVILNDDDSVFKSITNQVRGQQIYGLTFYKDYVFFGSRFNGLYVFNLSNKQLEKYFDTSQIGLFLKVKEIRDTIFFGTSKSAFYLLKKDKSWSLTKIYSAPIYKSGGVVTDFALWQNHIFASVYGGDNQYLYQFKKDSLKVSELIRPHEFPVDLLLTISMSSNDSLLILGGDGFTTRINKKQEKKFEELVTGKTIKQYPAWDAEIAGTRTYLALGNPDNNQEGMIYEPSKTNLEEVNSSFYGQCLYYDYKTKGMWAGTFNNGLYYWPAINESYHIPKSGGEFRFSPIDINSGILFSRDKVFKSDLSRNEFVEIFDGVKQNKRHRQILDAVGWGDTTAILFENGLFLLAGKKIIQSFGATQGNYIHKKGDHIYVFSLYYDFVVDINLKKQDTTLIRCPSNQIEATPYNRGNLFYHSAYTGFYYFDTTSHPLNIQFPLVESFTINADTLWTLQAGMIQTFRIDLHNYKLIPLFKNNLKDRVEGFSPKWIITNNGTIYCGDKKGFFTINKPNGNPAYYTYIGNFSQGKPPMSNDKFLYFNEGNYITRIDPTNYLSGINPEEVKIKIEPEKAVFEKTPFIIQFQSADYILQKHSLKEIEIIKGGKLIRTLFTIDDQLEFPAGMKKGDYLIKFKINDVPVGERELNVQIPLTSNPIFYAAIMLFIVVFLFVLLRSILNKRSYDKHILQNRLQLLKQNLNPHFIFNSLNLIYALVLQRKNEAAIKTINNFSDLHRYYLDNINKAKTTLEEELKFIESYLRLESARVEVDNPFIYKLPTDLSKEIKSVLIPPMILQPLVENAVKHIGAHSKMIGSVWIDVIEKGKQIMIAIENTTGNAETKTITSNGMGLKLVQERIEIFNKTFNENLSLQTGKPTLRCSNGYRVELLVDKIK